MEDSLLKSQQRGRKRMGSSPLAGETRILISPAQPNSVQLTNINEEWLIPALIDRFLTLHGAQLWTMGAVLLFGLPLLQVVWQLTFHQGIMGNFPMHARWRMHRHLLRQSIGFFQDDMAGRLANTIGSLKIEYRGPQGHQPTRDDIASRYQAAFDEVLW